MSLVPQSDAVEAAWLADIDVSASDFLTYGPPGFESYARIEIPTGAETPFNADVEVLSRVLRLLGEATTTPDRVFVGVWEGWGHSDPPGVRFSLPHRVYALLCGPLADVLDPIGLGLGDTVRSAATPHLIWPADRAWFVSWDVDEETHFTIAGAEAAIATVLGSPDVAESITVYGEPRPALSPDEEITDQREQLRFMLALQAALARWPEVAALSADADDSTDATRRLQELLSITADEAQTVLNMQIQRVTRHSRRQVDSMVNALQDWLRGRDNDQRP